MQVDDPPYLSVGTAVSAKYKGAFCEAKVSKVVHLVKCKVTYKMGLGNATLSDEQIKGPLRVGQLVQVKHPDRKELIDATITKIQDCSQYTVVFDDGDITTLRRTALCLKSGRHFNESETLDQLPLTHPEHFGNPVVGGRRGRRNRQLKEDSSDGEVEEENEPDLEAYILDIGRVVTVESTEKKRSKDNWFPGLVVIPSAQPTVRINVKDEYLIRSFKDGRYYTVPKKEVSEFNREMGEKVESSVLLEAVQKTLKYLDNNELPTHWEKSLLFNSQSLDSESDENFTDSSDDEPCEEKDRFVAQLYKFLDEAGTPLNKTPTIAAKDIDLHRLFRVVQKVGGYNRVTNQNKWRSVTARLRLPNNQSICNQVKSVYKKCLSSYETFHRTLGVTMLNHTRSNKKNRGRSLIRDKDRTTPMNSPRPEKEEEFPEKLDEKKEIPVQTAEPVKLRKKQDSKKIINVSEVSDTNSSDVTDQSESTSSSTKDGNGRPKREIKSNKEKKLPKPTASEKLKAAVEKLEEQQKKEDEEKGQQTRSKSLSKVKDPLVIDNKKADSRVNTRESRSAAATTKGAKKALPDEEKKRGRKRILSDDKTAEGDVAVVNINIGDKLKVYYGPTHESKVTYEAKVIEIDKDQSGPVYLVHYTGWNTRYDEWIQPQRIAENLSATTKAKRLKHINTSVTAKVTTKTAAGKRGRGLSVAGRSASVSEAPRSTTPSSVTSSSSRTKSPATPATRSTGRLTRQDSTKRNRRVSAHTDASVPSESESDASVSEFEAVRTKIGGKVEETEVRTYKRKIVKPSLMPKIDKRKEKEDEETEKEDEPEKPVKRTKKLKKSPEKPAEESEDEANPPKGRDFDLNQIRSELKGFAKAIKVPSVDTIEKEVVSSSDDSTNPPPPDITLCIEDENEEEKPKEKPLEKSSSSEDIYEFKEPEPFEFESRSKMVDDKTIKKRLVPRIFEDLEKSPKKKTIKSPPSKPEKIGSTSPEKKSFRKTLRKSELQDISDEEDPYMDDSMKSPPKKEDPFDKLVESPSFNLIKTCEKSVDKSSVTKNVLDEPLSLFRELPETVDDYSRDMELSDCESQTQIFTRTVELFSDTFSKSSPERNTLDLEFSSSKTDECKLKDSDDDDMIRAQIQRVIAQSSSTDDDSGDALLITPPTNSYQAKKRDIDPVPLSSILGIDSNSQTVESEPKLEEPIKEALTAVPPIELEEKQELPPPQLEKSAFSIVKQTISPALQETDSALLESIVSQQPVPLNTKLEETAKELSNVKTGTKIADSILQKFNSIKNKTENKTPVQETVSEHADVSTKSEFKFELPKEVKPNITEIKPKPLEVKPKYPDIKTNVVETPPVAADVKIKPESCKIDVSSAASPTHKPEITSDCKKRKKVVSKAFIEESESDSSDSEQLVIARSDEDSQTNSMDIKIPVEYKESDNSNPFAQILTTDDSQSQEEPRNFQFDIIRDKSPEPQVCVPKEEVSSVTKIKNEEAETAKEEEPDSHLHSLLLCEEEIPRSPAPATESVIPNDTKPNKSVLEMPFASAPGTSNSKSMLHLEHKKVHPLPLDLPVERERDRGGASAVLDNTPPTTPESTISTPSGDNGNLSPNTVDNESCKSNDNEPEYPRQRRNSLMKVSPYSEEDTQMTSDTSIVKKLKEELMPGSCKKRRKSLRGSDDAPPAKRGRKPMNRSRQNSDSDDTSEHSNTGSTNVGAYDRSTRSPRPSKYNFFVEFDPSLDSGQRIAVLQQKLSELRKTYADVKAELATVERRRKKIRRREREALKAAKQEMACA